MQTFLPFEDFGESARVLDWRRLGKQRLETQQILRACRYETVGWQNHPIVRMWRGFEPLLCLYGLDICQEWRNRGYRDFLYDYFWEQYSPEEILAGGLPPWLGFPPLHASHRGRLLAKDPEYYRKFGWVDRPVDQVLYVMPVVIKEKLNG